MNTLVVTKEHGTREFCATLDMVKLWLQTSLPGRYTITMKKVQDSRTIKQNKYMWVCFKVIADRWSEATGRVITKEAVHYAYCLQFLPVETPKGIVPGSTSGLSVEKMNWFIDSFKQDALETYDIELPEPESDFFAALAEEYSNQ